VTHANVNPRKLARSWTNRLGERVTLYYWPADRLADEQVVIQFTPDPVLSKPVPAPRARFDFAGTDNSFIAYVKEKSRQDRSIRAKNAPSKWRSFDRRLVEQVVGAILSCEIPALACVLDMVRGGECRMAEVRDTPRRRRHFNRMSELVGNPKDPEDRLRAVKAGSR
jgi:hypothetical protein